jgi:hypothetical protein
MPEPWHLQRLFKVIPREQRLGMEKTWRRKGSQVKGCIYFHSPHSNIATTPAAFFSKKPCRGEGAVWTRWPGRN